MKLCSVNQLRKTLLFTLFLGIFIFLCELLRLKKGACNQTESLRQLRLLCAQYKRKEVFGNMCASLCEESTFRFIDCSGNNIGKSVIIMECDGCITGGKTSKIVLKVWYDLENWQSLMSAKWGKLTKLPDKISVTINEIRAHSKANFDTDFGHTIDIISLMIGQDFNKTVEHLDSLKAIDTVLSTAMAFASQAEYLSFKILGSNSVLPKLYGTCGPAYFVENTPSLSFLNYVFFRGKKTDVLSMKWNFPPWSARAEAALSILKMVREMEDSFDTVLQNCDIQPYNLGLSGRGDVVILDSDSLKFRHVFDHHPPCQSDSDCALLTCLGKCNQSTKSCVTEMTSTNLHVI